MSFPNNLSAYPPGTPMSREELSQGSFRPPIRIRQAQIDLEKKRRDLIDLLGRIIDHKNPIESEERIRLIDMNIDLAKQRVKAVKAAKAAQSVRITRGGKDLEVLPPLTYIPPVPSPASSSPNVKAKHVAKGEDEGECECEGEGDQCGDSDCSLTNDEFEASFAPYVKETLKSTLNMRSQELIAQCIEEGLEVPPREAVVCRVISELRERVEEHQPDDHEDRFIADVALKFLDEFYASQQKGET